jgi:hypothetical protein
MRCFVQGENMNRKFKRVACVLGLLSLLLLTTSILRSEPPKKLQDTEPDVTKTFMRGKLINSQKILEGLTTKKFELIQEGAKELQKMSEAASWKRSSNDVYLHYSREFSRLAEKLDGLAKDRNLEGASFTYMNMVGTCLSCHAYSRDVLRIAKQKKSPFRLLGEDPDEKPVSK